MLHNLYYTSCLLYAATPPLSIPRAAAAFKSGTPVWRAAFRLCRGERDPDLRALPHLAFELDDAMVVLHGVLYDGQAQPRAA